MSDYSSSSGPGTTKSSKGAKPKSPRRYRICGTPVRTGCRTCKIRRVKCGEEKPFCKRCTSTGRRCDGYEIITDPKKPSSTKKQTSISTVVQSNALQDSLEPVILDFFRAYTVAEFAGDFSTEFWERRIFQAATVEPSIRHCILALGAIHKNYIETYQQAQAAKYPTPTQAFAFRQYTKAIRILRESIVRKPHSLEVTLISCILFICFDCLVGDQAAGLVHLKSGLRILDDINATNAPSSVAAQCARDYSPLLLVLGGQIAAFMNPKAGVDRGAFWAAMKRAGCSTSSFTPFQSLEEARYALRTLGADILHTRHTNWRHVTEEMVTSEFGPMARSHYVALENWSNRLNAFTEKTSEISGTTSPLAKRPIRIRGASILKSHHLLLSMNATESHTPAYKFEEMLDLSEELVREDKAYWNYRSMPRFMVDTGLIVPVVYTAVRSKDIEHKKRAIEILAQVPGREGLWDTQRAIHIIEGELAGKIPRLKTPYFHD
ncbi:e32295e1-7485-4bd1-9e09-2b32c334c8f3 [Sclerotinia trifoliorum]|uniref:E32295e1-7485-4bd1-9e09-2b32c334c8f3 n=1 Tax=Sclerotinia trifoliorum TaxID=28548 RepID=A0A8H2VQ10_9HELO|nr:e32295e1-7485-4bd1-9e09-2b32c334c8f3 [Sclerotinia trifoliorum]